MKLQILPSFQRDIKKAPQQIVAQLHLIITNIQSAVSIADIPKIKKLSGYKNAYRIRVDDHRIGLFLQDETIVLVRLLSRKDVYKYFP